MKLSDHGVFVKEGQTPILSLGLAVSKRSKEEMPVINNLTKPLGEAFKMYSEIK
ncbi:hypothetical protein NIES3585_13910 [Nodularia sp. NIES-3585]|nr:hypothetical protein NIES3585_13910 [Nodularia sp. NIES-3585]